MADAWLIGAFSTTFGKKPDRTYKDLTREAYLGVLADAGMDDGAEIDLAWFGNCTMHMDGQANSRGQVCMAPLVGEGLFPERVPLVNIENACATTASALATATFAVRGGASELGLVMGVEKLIEPGTGRGRFEAFDGTLDQFDPEVVAEATTPRRATPPASPSRWAPTAPPSWTPTPCRPATT